MEPVEEMSREEMEQAFGPNKADTSRHKHQDEDEDHQAVSQVNDVLSGGYQRFQSKAK